MSNIMGSSSEEETDVSDSELDDYIEKPYELLKSGKYIVKNRNATFRCPFCVGKKKQEYSFHELIQHASGVGTAGSSNRSGKQKARHLALLKYLQEDLVDESGSQNSKAAQGKSSEQTKQERLYVWPWKGIVANISSKLRDQREISDCAYWLSKFSQYKPVEVDVLRDKKELISYVMLGFGEDMIGYKNVIKFESDFEANLHGRSDWNSQGMNLGYDFYGWCAREVDYNLKGVIGTYLRANTKLYTISDIERKSKVERNMILTNTAKELEIANNCLYEFEYRCSDNSAKLSRVIEDTDRLHWAHNEEKERMQQFAQDNVRRIVKETEEIKLEIDCRKTELDRWCKELSEREALTICERRKIEVERKRRNEELELATTLQMKANKSIVKLLEKQKTEKEAVLKELLDKEKQMNEEHKLQLEVEESRRQLNLFECMRGDDDKEKQKMEEMEEKMNEKIEELEYVKSIHRVLEEKEQENSEEISVAREAMIVGWSGQLKGRARSTIGIKKIGEINIKPFQVECKKRDRKGALKLSALIHSEWQANIQDPSWNPFKDIATEGMEKKVIVNEEDQKLKSLRSEWGEEAYKAVVTALEEMYENNPEGRHVIPELWNYAQNRKATLKEAIAFVVKSISMRQNSR